MITPRSDCFRPEQRLRHDDGRIETIGDRYNAIKDHLPHPDRMRAFAGPYNVPTGLIYWRGMLGRAIGLMVGVGIEPRAGGTWHHVSVSRSSVLPSQEDLAFIRRAFFQPQVVVVQVFPPEDEYVNIHPNCLHLWSRIDGERLIPDLRVDGMI